MRKEKEIILYRKDTQKLIEFLVEELEYTTINYEFIETKIIFTGGEV